MEPLRNMIVLVKSILVVVRVTMIICFICILGMRK